MDSLGAARTATGPTGQPLTLPAGAPPQLADSPDALAAAAAAWKDTSKLPPGAWDRASGIPTNQDPHQPGWAGVVVLIKTRIDTGTDNMNDGVIVDCLVILTPDGVVDISDPTYES